MDFKDAHNQNVKITGYPTEKNPLLLKRIIEASSNPGDLVLDCFSGSGTTLAVADVLQRSWIGVDTSSTAIQMTLQRFVKGTEPMGDFVSMNNDNGNKTRGKSSQKSIDVLPLFKNYSDQQAVQKKKTPSKHPPITDFILYAEEERQTEVQSIAEEWLSENRMCYGGMDAQQSIGADHARAR
jgi:adenine-specific DNA-methyltransferase